MSQLHKEANYFKICRLLIGKGGNAFRGVVQTSINKSHPPSTLDSFLNSNKSSLNNLRSKPRVITPTQWDMLFPPSGSPDLKIFDITLLTILLRNICGLPSPASGWDASPLASDTSVSAEILRIKTFRNDVYAHLPCPELDDIEFERLWQEISKPLIKLGIPQQDIDELKEAPLSREEESHQQELKEWKERDDELISKLKHVEEEVDNVKKRVTNVENDVIKLQPENVKSSAIKKLAKFPFKGKRKELTKKLQLNTRKWFFEKFERWLDDKESRVMILTAGPGVGNSVLSAKVCELYEESGQLAACHFCDFRTSDNRDPYRILQSLASQMCDNVDGFCDELAEALSREHSQDSLSGIFRVLLNDPLQALHKTEPMLIVVDALDESKTPTKSELLDLISDQFSELPKWIKIFISSRPELQVREKLKHLHPMEILPDDDHHNFDLKQFIQHNLPNISRFHYESLVSMCEGSFLYAYYLVKEIEQGEKSYDKLNVNVDIPKGISGFYEKQFERLKKDLQCYEQKTGVSIFKNFINVVAASDKPLPFRFLFACMDLFGERFEIRKTIVGIMSEILPVYDDCLTVFHKSLWDWLKLDGYDEHAYAADVADGKKRLWRACKKVYTDIDSLSSVSDFQISPEKRYALENGAKHCMNVDSTEDWEWLVNVKVNYFKFYYCLDNVEQHTTTRLVKILEEYKSRISYDLSLKLIQLYAFLKMIRAIILTDIRVYHRMYLQCFANKQFCLVHNAATSRKDASEMLRQTNTIWLEEVTNEADSSFKIISSTFFKDNAKIEAISTSPQNNLLAIIRTTQLNVYELPGLGNILKLNLNEIIRKDCPNIAFSPDSLYLILNSLQKYVSIKHKGVLPFIPHGPAKILSCSFSSCGTKLVSVDEKSIKVWDLTKRELSAESRHQFDLSKPITCFSSCKSYIFLFDSSDGQLNVCDSTTLNVLETARTDTCSTKLDNCIQFISPRSSTGSSKALRFNIECWQLTTGQNILCARKHCSMPFVWRDRKCVMTLSSTLALVVYDYVNQQVIDTFQLSSLPSYRSIVYIANLRKNTFLICSQNFLFVLSLESSSEFSAVSFINDDTYPIFCSLSPDNLYVACNYGSPVLKIMTVDDGKILQTVIPKQKPIDCWWSVLYLWVVCEGSVVVKYPYISTDRNVVGNNAEECCIDCGDDVLKFKAGVFVCRAYRKISISKICDKNLSRQQILDSKLDSSCEVAISSDGCAVLLYKTCRSCLYELWEMGSENYWELHSTGKLDPLTWGACLAGKQNFRRLLWLSAPDDFGEESALCSIDFSDATPKTVVHQLPIELFFPDVVYVDCKVLIFCDAGYIHLIHVPDGTVITSLYVGYIEKSFFVPSKLLLFLFTGNGNIKPFKIRNVDQFFPPK